MTNEEIKNLKEKLEKELSTLKKGLQSVGRRNPDNPADWEPLPEKMDISASDDNEVADNIEAYEENAAILKELEIRFNEIKEALKRIGANAYGTCEVCKKPVEKERLEANPAATTCKEHKG